jgi:hypothetical protein
MKKIILLLFTLPLFIYFITCDRADMYNTAKYGPEPDAIYLFTDNIQYYGNFSIAGGPFEACRDALQNTFYFLDISRIEPLLSTSKKDARDIVPSIYSHVEVIGVTSG